MITTTPMNNESARLLSANEQLLTLRSNLHTVKGMGHRPSRPNNDLPPLNYPALEDRATTTLTPKQKRQLWRLYVGDRPNQALRQLTPETDPLVSFLTSLFQAGYVAVQKVRFSNFPLALLIDDILKGDHVPDVPHPIRPDVPNNTLNQVKKECPVDFSPGSGQFPSPPAHTCTIKNGAEGENRRGSLLTISKFGTTFTPLTNAQWRETTTQPVCLACLHKRVIRLCQQLLTMSLKHHLVWAEMGNDEFKRLTARIRQKRHRYKEQIVYCAYPQSDEQYVVICEPEQLSNPTKAHEIPLNKGELYELMLTWAQTPADKRVSASANWGEQWQGTRGDGRIKQAQKDNQPVGAVIQLRTSATVREAAKLLGDLISEKTVTYGFFYTRRDPEMVCRMLTEAGHDLGLLNNEQTGLTAVLTALAEAGVTDKSQKDDPKYLCDLSVTVGKVAGQEVGLKWEQRPLDSVIIEPSTHR